MEHSNEGNGAIPFCDTLVTPQTDNSLSITVFHKSTHTDQYLQWHSHHNLSAKYSVIGTLTHRAKTVSTKPELFQKELQHLRKALIRCKYPNWAINRVQSKYINSNWEDNNKKNNLQDNSNPSTNMDKANQSRDNITNSQDTHNPSASTEEAPTRQKPTIGFVVIPYTQGIAESFRKMCGTHGMQTYFKGNTTINQDLIQPKDQDPKDKKSGVICSYQCGDIACGEKYKGTTSRTLGERYKEHLKQPSPILVHIQQTGHNSTSKNFKIIGREDQGLARTIKEAIYIRVNNPTLDRNIGKYNLNHIWDSVLFNTPGLKIGSPQNQAHIHNNCQAQTNITNSKLQIVLGHTGHALNSKHVLRES